MDRSDVCTLLKYTRTQNDAGVWVDTLSSQREVFCHVDSVTRSEFFEGGRSGLNPEYRISMFYGDYEGEAIVLYNGLPYSVYRTYYAKNDIIELYVERKGGTNARP